MPAFEWAELTFCTSALARITAGQTKYKDGHASPWLHQGAAEKAIHLGLGPDERHGMLNCQGNCKSCTKVINDANRRLAGMRFHASRNSIEQKRVCERSTPCGCACKAYRDWECGQESFCSIYDQKAWEASTMPRTKQKHLKHLKKAVPLAGVVGVSMAMPGASATGVVGPEPDVYLRDTAPQLILDEEEIFDVSLGTFFVFDREADLAGVQYAQRGCRATGCRAGVARCAVVRGCRACGGCRGCAIGGCRACRACAGCAGCSCGCCVSWGACRFIC
jgi:hypothetical protein